MEIELEFNDLENVETDGDGLKHLQLVTLQLDGEELTALAALIYKYLNGTGAVRDRVQELMHVWELVTGLSCQAFETQTKPESIVDIVNRINRRV